MESHPPAAGHLQYPIYTVTPSAAENENECSAGILKETNHNKITIRRLQAEINRITVMNEEKEKAFKDENDSLRESLRRCISDLEKEKAMKETLQQCVNALKLSPGNILPNSPPAGNGGNGNEASDGRYKQPRKCKFYNRQEGCKNGVDQW